MATFTCPNCGEGNLVELHNEFARCRACGQDTPLPANPNPHPEPLMSEEHNVTRPLPSPQLYENEGSDAPPNIDSPAEGPVEGTPFFPDFNPAGDRNAPADWAEDTHADPNAVPDPDSDTVDLEETAEPVGDSPDLDDNLQDDDDSQGVPV